MIVPHHQARHGLQRTADFIPLPGLVVRIEVVSGATNQDCGHKNIRTSTHSPTYRLVSSENSCFHFVSQSNLSHLFKKGMSSKMKSM